jgi:predicted porin
MKKSLIAVAVASAFIAPAAMADVTLSGAVNLGIEYAKSSAGTAAGSPGSLSRTLLNSNYSHVDMESVDDIGGGNKVIFHYQLQIQTQNSTGVNDVNRNSFLGVAGGWGAFKMGTNENVYERFMYTADPLDGALGPGGNLMLLGTPGGCAFQTGQDTLGVGGNGATGAQQCFYRRTDHTIWYESPNWGGFTFEVDYTLSAFKTAATPGGAPAIDPKVLSVGGKWQPEGAPFYIDLAYEDHEDMFGALGAPGAAGFGTVATTTANSSKDTGMQVGGGWQLGDLGLHLRYEQLKYKLEGITAGPTEYKRNAYWLGVKYNLPSGYVGAEIGVAQDGKTNVADVSDTGATIYGIGYFHNLSKQSQLQFIYGNTSNKDNATYGQAGAPNFGVAGSDHQVLHVGLKHTF